MFLVHISTSNIAQILITNRSIYILYSQNIFITHLFTYLASQVYKNLQNGYLPLSPDKNVFGTDFN